jgi:ATP-binding cassette, subfamily B, bacterial
MGTSYDRGKSYKSWVRSYAGKNWFNISLLLFLSLIGVAIGLAAPLPLQVIIDSIFGESELPGFISDLNLSPNTLLYALILSYACIHLLGLVFEMIRAYVQIKSNQRIDRATMQDEFNAAARIPYNDQVRGSAIDSIYEVTSQSQALSSYILDNTSSIFMSILSLIGTLAALYLISPIFSVVVLITLPLLAFITVKFGKKLEARASDTETAHGEIYTFVSESLEKLRTIQAFAYIPKRLASLTGLINVRNKYATRQLVTSQTYNLLTNGIIIIAMTATLGIGALAVDAGTMTLGFLIVALTYLEMSFGQISVIADVLGSISSQKATIKQAYELIERSAMFTPQGESSPITGSIEFRDVTLKKGEKEIFTNLNINIPAGSIVGIVGPSGSGKTTLIDSLLRFTDVHGGQILIDNVNVQTYNIDWLRSNIALVEQEPDLFEGTINENISLADPSKEFNLLHIMAAGSVAELSEYLHDKSAQDDKTIDNNRLSGGQKQRIAIARAFYKNSPIIILDEPTSALDSTVGHKVIDNIIESSAGHTVLMITHDLSLLKKLPYIFVVEDGKIQDIVAYGGVDEYFRQHSDLLSN